MKTSVDITFGIIVLNGEPFTRYCLREIYPFAHQIVVVEGACEGARRNSTADGHSTDGTLEVLRQFQAVEDPEGKVIIVTAEDEGHPDGFWPGEKDEQSQAYAKRANGDYLWQVDIDEFYRYEDVLRIVEYLKENPDVTSLSFKQIQFWGGFDCCVDGWYLRRGGENFHRIFKWGQGYKYVKHRPPTVVTAEGVDTRKIRWIDSSTTCRWGIRLYHYSLVFPKQVQEKSIYYGAASWAKRSGSEQWADEIFMQLRNPFRVHNVFSYPSWLQKYSGTHPAQIERLREDLASGLFDIKTRDNSDIEKLLSDKFYNLKIFIIKHYDNVDRGKVRLNTWLHEKKRAMVNIVKLFLRISV